MTIKVRPGFVIAGVALFGVLVGMAIGQVTHAGAGSEATASGQSLYPIYRQLQSINAKLGSNVAGSIAPVLRNIEINTEKTCAAVEGHRFGGC